MSIQMTKTWFFDGKIIQEEIPESKIYARPWNIEECKAYAVQLRDKNRANTAEHAAEAIEYLLNARQQLEALLERQTARIVDLQTHINNLEGEDR